MKIQKKSARLKAEAEAAKTALQLEQEADVAQDTDAPVDAVQDTPTKDGRIRLCADISRAHHRKLKTHAAMEGKTLLEVIEALIDRHCITIPPRKESE